MILLSCIKDALKNKKITKKISYFFASIGFIVSVLAGLCTIQTSFGSSDKDLGVTRLERMMLTISSAVPDEKKCILTSPEEITEVCNKIISLSKESISTGVTMMQISKNVDNSSAKVTEYQKQFNALLQKAEMLSPEAEKLQIEINQADWSEQNDYILSKMDELTEEAEKNRKRLSLSSKKLELALQNLEEENNKYTNILIKNQENMLNLIFFVANNKEYLPRQVRQQVLINIIPNIIIPCIDQKTAAFFRDLFLNKNKKELIKSYWEESFETKIPEEVLIYIDSVLNDIAFNLILKEISRANFIIENYETESAINHNTMIITLKLFLKDYYGIQYNKQ